MIIFRFVLSVLAGIVAVLCVLGGFWLGGFNFDCRGEFAVVCYVCSIFAMLLGFMLTSISTEDLK